MSEYRARYRAVRMSATAGYRLRRRFTTAGLGEPGLSDTEQFLTVLRRWALTRPPADPHAPHPDSRPVVR